MTISSIGFLMNFLKTLLIILFAFQCQFGFASAVTNKLFETATHALFGTSTEEKEQQQPTNNEPQTQYNAGQSRNSIIRQQRQNIRQNIIKKIEQEIKTATDIRNKTKTRYKMLRPDERVEIQKIVTEMYQEAEKRYKNILNLSKIQLSDYPFSLLKKIEKNINSSETYWKNLEESYEDIYKNHRTQENTVRAGAEIAKAQAAAEAAEAAAEAAEAAAATAEEAQAAAEAAEAAANQELTAALNTAKREFKEKYNPLYKIFFTENSRIGNHYCARQYDAMTDDTTNLKDRIRFNIMDKINSEEIDEITKVNTLDTDTAKLFRDCIESIEKKIDFTRMNKIMSQIKVYCDSLKTNNTIDNTIFSAETYNNLHNKSITPICDLLVDYLVSEAPKCSQDIYALTADSEPITIRQTLNYCWNINLTALKYFVTMQKAYTNSDRLCSKELSEFLDKENLCKGIKDDYSNCCKNPDSHDNTCRENGFSDFNLLENMKGSSFQSNNACRDHISKIANQCLERVPQKCTEKCTETLNKFEHSFKQCFFIYTGNLYKNELEYGALFINWGYFEGLQYTDQESNQKQHFKSPYHCSNNNNDMCNILKKYYKKLDDQKSYEEFTDGTKVEAIEKDCSISKIGDRKADNISYLLGLCENDEYNQEEPTANQSQSPVVYPGYSGSGYSNKYRQPRRSTSSYTRRRGSSASSSYTSRSPNNNFKDKVEITGSSSASGSQFHNSGTDRINRKIAEIQESIDKKDPSSDSDPLSSFGDTKPDSSTDTASASAKDGASSKDDSSSGFGTSSAAAESADSSKTGKKPKVTSSTTKTTRKESLVRRMSRFAKNRLSRSRRGARRSSGSSRRPASYRPAFQSYQKRALPSNYVKVGNKRILAGNKNSNVFDQMRSRINDYCHENLNFCYDSL